MDFLNGHLLVASPYLPDPNFYRSVVLIVNHDRDHAFGLLLNRPGHDRLSMVWEQASGRSVDVQATLRVGGPLEGPLMIIHEHTDHADVEIVSGVYLSTQNEKVTRLIEEGFQSLIPIAGYSGWGPGQLERELEMGGWMTTQATDRLVFCAPEEQWELATRVISEDILSDTVRRIPDNAGWN